MHWARAGINLFRPVSSILWEDSHECIIIIRGAFLAHNKRTNAQIVYRYGEISLRLKIMQLRQNVDYSHLQGTFAIITKKSVILRSLPLLPQTGKAPQFSLWCLFVLTEMTGGGVDRAFSAESMPPPDIVVSVSRMMRGATVPP